MRPFKKASCRPDPAPVLGSGVSTAAFQRKPPSKRKRCPSWPRSSIPSEAPYCYSPFPVLFVVACGPVEHFLFLAQKPPEDQQSLWGWRAHCGPCICAYPSLPSLLPLLFTSSPISSRQPRKTIPTPLLLLRSIPPSFRAYLAFPSPSCVLRFSSPPCL